MYPFQRPNPLQQVLDAIQGGQELPIDGGGGYASPLGASASPPAGDPMSALIARMSRPEAYQRQEELPEATKKQKILAGIKDAIAGYIEGRTGRQVSYAGAQDRIRATREKNKQIREQNRLGEQRAAAESDRQSALLEYQRLQLEKQQAIRAAEREQDIAERKARDIREASLETAKENIRTQRHSEDLQAKYDIAEENADSREELARIKASTPKPGKPDPNVAKQQKKAEEVMKFIGSAAPSMDKMLTRGTMSPDDVRRTLQREMDARNLDGEDRQRVINYFAKHILPILKKHEAQMRTGG